ncbi:lactate utilization protein C [Sneathiella sp.]|uniref:LutC/YkgG family protein n=1 Tax=Sneathiella sp. TaxID=1964365 RepID=UPI0035652162
MTPREKIFGRIRENLGRGPREGNAAEALRSRITGHVRQIIPARAQIPHAAQVDMFQARAEALAATVSRVASLTEVPEAVQDYLTGHNLPSRIKMSPPPALDGIPFDTLPMMEITRGPAHISDEVSLTPAFTGIAETGTLCLASGPETPSTLNFLPENHIVILKASQITGTLEDSWDRLRKTYGEGNLPRTVNFISGPSRTGDIEQTLIMGAHGPRRLHIVIVDDGPEV